MRILDPRLSVPAFNGCSLLKKLLFGNLMLWRLARFNEYMYAYVGLGTGVKAALLLRGMAAE